MKINKKMEQNGACRMSDRKLEASHTSIMVCRYVVEVVHAEACRVPASFCRVAGSLCLHTYAY